MSTALLNGEMCSRPLFEVDAFLDSIVARVREELRRSSYVAIRTFTCECHCGVLAISGRSPNYYLKQMAVSLAMHCLQSHGAGNIGIDVNGISVGDTCYATL